MNLPNQPPMTTIRVASADTSLTDLEENIAGMNGGDQVREKSSREFDVAFLIQSSVPFNQNALTRVLR